MPSTGAASHASGHTRPLATQIMLMMPTNCMALYLDLLFLIHSPSFRVVMPFILMMTIIPMSMRVPRAPFSSRTAVDCTVRCPEPLPQCPDGLPGSLAADAHQLQTPSPLGPPIMPPIGIGSPLTTSV